MGRTRIEWATDVWNPVTGCTKVSPGCKNCYAERMIGRFQSLHGYGLPTLEGDAVDPPRFHEVQLHPDRLDQPRHWRKPRKVFVCSMSDLFHRDVPDDFIAQVWATMWAAGPSSWLCDDPLNYTGHTFQILTKRADRMQALLSSDAFFALVCKAGGLDLRLVSPVPFIWLGVSVEDQQAADERIPLLLQTPAAVRFVSVEPMLGQVDLECYPSTSCPTGWLDDGGLDWVICGGESGPHARPMHPDWARSLRDQCQAARVPFFMKQICKRGRKILYGDFPSDLQVREFPHANH